MKIHITIYSYEREEMLRNLIEEIKVFSASGYDVTYNIIDDGSSFNHFDNFHQFKHGGKPLFWERWDYGLRQAELEVADMYLFIPSDYSKIDFKGIIKRHLNHNHLAYAYNVINDGRTFCWNMVRPINIDEHTLKVGFTDCGFFCNRQALDRLGYYVSPVNPLRFVDNPAISSGVGQQLTQRMRKMNVNMYLPKKSYAYHGDHPSTMHKEEREKNPLKSK